MNQNHVERAVPNQNSILIVEDDSTTQILIGKMVHKVDRNAELHFARNVKTAMGLIQLQSFNLVISANRLNGSLTGLDLFAEYKAQPNPPQFILISGSKIANLPMGDNAPMYFQKPLPPFKFRSVVEKLLLKNRPEVTSTMSADDAHEQKFQPSRREWAILALIGLATIAIAFAAIRFVAAAPEKSNSHGVNSADSIVSSHKIPKFRR